ncbi:hypothetical protein H6768_00395 [Candidatus Peribacteria bacterium]|nr:hypothetical protein [Candidatus Peribacteria bacterium]
MQASVSFSDALLSYESEVTQRLIDRADIYLEEREPKHRAEAIEGLFVQYGTSFNSLLCDDFLLIFREIQIFQREKFLTACHESESIYTKISNAYQIGMKIVYDIWRDIYRAFVVRYGRIPTPDELKKFENFIVDFTKNIAQTPSFFSVPIRDRIINVQAQPNLFFNQEGVLQFDSKKLKIAQNRAHIEIGQHPPEKLKSVLANRYCPALPRIPKIAQMCCNIFRETYVHVYNRFEE